jgi:hypothetical protein
MLLAPLIRFLTKCVVELLTELLHPQQERGHATLVGFVRVLVLSAVGSIRMIEGTTQDSSRGKQ